MTVTISMSDWVETIEREYLDDFIPEGGAAVKFLASCDGATATSLAEEVARVARAHGLVTATISASDVRIHMLDKIFNAVARQIPWRELILARLTALAAESFTVPERLELGGFARQVASVNGVDENYVRMALEQRIGQAVFKDRRLARDFRIAMTWMCRGVLGGGAEGDTQFEDVCGWLTGEVKAISAMKQYMIYTKINRANARHHFESLLTWVRQCARKGTVVVIDGSRFTESQRHADGSVNYTKGSRLDAYEVFRQFIDSTDDMSSMLLVVTTDEEFLDIGPGSKGLGAYQALMNRVYDEVRDRHRVNPMTSLVRVGKGDQT